MKARNEEYNEFLQEKKRKDAHRFDNKKPASSRVSLFCNVFMRQHD